jgi:hypothetical protein
MYKAVIAVMLSAAALSGCDTLRDAAGLAKKSPDEFAVTTKAPLIIPPDFNLRPPAPGAPPANQLDPTSTAQNAMFNNSDPQTVAAGMRGDYTPGEKLFLANARVQNADPGVRAKLQADSRVMQNADSDFTDRVLGGGATPDTAGKAVNADAEISKGRASSKPAPAKEDSGGWFDWF